MCKNAIISSLIVGTLVLFIYLTKGQYVYYNGIRLIPGLINYILVLSIVPISFILSWKVLKYYWRNENKLRVVPVLLALPGIFLSVYVVLLLISIILITFFPSIRDMF